MMTIPKILMGIIAATVAIYFTPTAWVYCMDHVLAGYFVKYTGVEAYLDSSEVKNLWVHKALPTLDRSEIIRFDADVPTMRKFIAKMPCKRVGERYGWLDWASNRSWWKPPSNEIPQLRLDCTDKDGFIEISIQILEPKIHRAWIHTYTT